METQSDLKIVGVMDPTECLRCIFACIATVEFTDGSIRRMLHCRRGDCDNWMLSDESQEE